MFPPEMQTAADEAIDAALSHRQQTCWEEEWHQNRDHYRNIRLWSGEGGKKGTKKVEEEEEEGGSSGPKHTESQSIPLPEFHWRTCGDSV